MEAQVLELSAQFPVVMLTGARQVGKSTLLEHIKEAARRTVSLDDMRWRQLAQEDPAMFLELNPPPLLIDEVQYAPQLFNQLKIEVDKRKIMGEYWLTGSQAFGMMDLASESLAGRVGILHLLPLSQQEVYGGAACEPFNLAVEELKKRSEVSDPATTLELFDRILSGYMPALVSGRVKSWNHYYSSFIQTYLERDVRNLDSKANLVDFTRFMTVVAARTSQLLNIADIAKDMGIRQDKAKEWLAIMQKCDIVFLLQPYHNNSLMRAIKTPKIYFYDTGLAVYLTRWMDASTLQAGAMSGAVFENYVVSEIIKSFYNSGINPLLYFYRDRDGKEIDMVLEANGEVHALEIKQTATPLKKMTDAFRLLDKSPIKRGTGAIICMSDTLGALDSKDLIIPAWAV
jgi:predicted AAA+ superfamily ATPase